MLRWVTSSARVMPVAGVIVGSLRGFPAAQCPELLPRGIRRTRSRRGDGTVDRERRVALGRRPYASGNAAHPGRRDIDGSPPDLLGAGTAPSRADRGATRNRLGE